MPQKVTLQEFIKRAVAIHGNKYDYSLVTHIATMRQKITIICDTHDTFEQTPEAHTKNKQGCPLCAFTKNRRTHSAETFIEACKQIHGDKYDYSKVIYTNKDAKVTIICKIHGEFDQCANSHKRGSGCKKCTSLLGSKIVKWNTETFIEACQQIHGDMYIYDQVNYTKGTDNIIIECKIHGEFKQRAKNHLHLGHGCPKCGLKNGADKQRFSLSTFIDKANKVHKNQYDYSKVIYSSCDNNVIIICSQHGEYKQTPYNHINMEHGCSKCAINQSRMEQKEFIDKCMSIHGNQYDYSDTKYEISRNKIRIYCNSCQTYFSQSPQSHVKGIGCLKCSKKQYSKMQIHWLQFLEQYYVIKIQHIANSTEEYRIPNTKWKADGYCKETNTIYEFHGDFWHGNPNRYNPEMINTVCKRKMKNLYKKTIDREIHIRELGYNLVVIWESEWNSINSAFKKLQRKFRSAH